MDIEAGARKHDVTDNDMLHALRHHWRSFQTDDPAVTLFIWTTGKRRTGRSRRRR